MGQIVYDPEATAAQYGAPPGRYLCICRGAEDQPPFAESKYGKTKEPRLRWKFEITTPGEHLGKILQESTGTYPSEKSGLVRLVNMLIGGAGLQRGMVIDPDAFVGRVYDVNWAVNPKSESNPKRCHIASMMEVVAERRGGPQPPIPPAVATLAPRPEARYYHLSDGGEVLGPVSADEVRGMIARGVDPAKLTLCREGGDEWHGGAHFGFARPTPPAPPRPAAPPPPPRRPAPLKLEGVKYDFQNPPQPAATPAPSIPKWWVKTDAPGIPDEDDGCELMDPVALSQWAAAQKPPRSAESIRVCPEGGGASDFRTAAEAGLKVDIPF